MSDDRPTSSGNMDDRPDRPVVCTKCGAKLRRDATSRNESRDGREGPMFHRLTPDKRNRIGAVCGPVAYEFRYHVTLWLSANGTMSFLRRNLPTLEHPEENYDAVIGLWERVVGAQFKAIDAEKGTALVGVAAPQPVVADWKLIGARL